MSDAYNENPIDSSSNDHNLIDTELQVRLMNLVLGEASDFERDQLQLLLEQRPELAAYCKHLEHLHGLLREVGAGEPTIDVDSATDNAEWRLPADRRERVLAVLENRSSELPPKVTLANQRSFRNWRTTTMEAIVVASIACVILGLMLPATQSAREAGQRLSIIEQSRYRMAEGSPLAAPANRAIVGKALNTVLSASEPVAPSAATTDLYSHPSSFGSLSEAYVVGGSGLPDDFNSVSAVGGKVMSKSTTSSVDDALKMLDQDGNGNMEGKPSRSAGKEVTKELGSAPNGTTAMARSSNGGSVAGQTLSSPYYLSDDVQYFPAGPEKKLASEPQVSGTLDGLAVQEKGQPYGEQQLAESKFGLAADGEIAMARRGSTASKPSEVVAPNLPGNATAPALSSNGAIAPNYRYIQPGSAVPAFTTDLAPAFGAPESGAAVVRPMAITPPSLWYKDFETKTATTENKIALEPLNAILIDDLTEAEGLKVGSEKQNAQSNFGGLAAKGEDNMVSRGGKAAGVATWESGVAGATRKPVEATESETSFSVAESEPSNRSVTINGASIPGIRNKISKSGQEDLVENDTNGEVDYPNIQSPIPVLPSGSEQLLAQSDEKVWQKLGNRRLEHYGDIILTPKSRDQLDDTNKLDSVQSTATTPDAGSIMLGGIKRFREQGQNGSNTLMMTVTPRIIIPEEEEEPLGVNLSETGPEIASRDRIELKKDAKPSAPRNPITLNRLFAQTGKESPEPNADTKESGYPLTNRLNPNSTKELVIKEVQPGAPIDLTEEVNVAIEVDRLKSSIAKLQSDLSTSSMARKTSRSRESAPSPELAKNGRDGAKVQGKPSAPKQSVTLDEQSASAEAFSTFSLHVSDVSFKLAQAALGQSQWPEPAKIRIEEFVNAMDYHDPLPSGDQKIACRVEQAIHPFVMQRNLLRVSMRTAAAGRSQNTPLRLTLLLDNSGSMERPDRRQAVLRAFQTLTQQLKATDQVTLISFASSPRLLADKVPGNQGETLLKLIETLPSEGGTNIESALQLAREKAAEQQVAGAQNRIVLLTDGAVNLGDANPENLAKQVIQMRDAGIAFDAAGISAQDLNDEVLEALTRQGDGRYYLLDSAEAASESFAAQIAGSLRPSAQNVKVQVEFNPQRVGRYKLLGYEKHRLNKEDFRNDQVDAAEMAAAEAGVAVYQYEIKPKGSGDVGSVSVRFRDLSTGQMVERRWPILYESNTPRLEQSQPSMQLATAAALFAAKLGGGPLADSVDMAQLQKTVAKLPEQFASQPRVQQLRTMIEQAIAIH